MDRVSRASLPPQVTSRVGVLRTLLVWLSLAVLVATVISIVVRDKARKTAEESLAEKKRIVLLLRLHENAMRRSTDQLIGVREALLKNNSDDKPNVEASYVREGAKPTLPPDPLLIIGPDTSTAAYDAYLAPGASLGVNDEPSPILMVSVTGTKLRAKLKEKLGDRIAFAGPNNADAADVMAAEIRNAINKRCSRVAFSVNTRDESYAKDLYVALHDKLPLDLCTFAPVPSWSTANHNDGTRCHARQQKPDRHSDKLCTFAPVPDWCTAPKLNDEPCLAQPEKPYCAWVIIGNAEWYKAQNFDAVKTNIILVSDGIAGEPDQILKLYSTTSTKPTLKAVRASHDHTKDTGCMGQRFWGKIAGQSVDLFWNRYADCTQVQHKPDVECRMTALRYATNVAATFKVKACN